MTLTSILDFCGTPNLPGILLVEYLPIIYIDQNQYDPVISSDHYWKRTIYLKQGTWLKAPLLVNRRLWRERQRPNEQGPYYDQTVTGIIPNLRPEVSGQFQSMAHQDFLLRIEDQQQQKWILGDIDNAFQFFADGTTAENGGLKHHAVRFVAKTPYKAYGFAPV